jgi:hypothetical protein
MINGQQQTNAGRNMFEITMVQQEGRMQVPPPQFVKNDSYELIHTNRIHNTLPLLKLLAFRTVGYVKRS